MAQILPMLRRPDPGVAAAGHFDWEGFQIAFEVHGPDSGTPVVLVHGILLDSACNRDLALSLAEAGYKVVLLDLLGHGASSRPRHSKWLRVDLYADQIRCCLNHLGLDRVVLGGVSLGAISSLQFTSEHPERVQGLLLEMPVMERAAPAAALTLIPVLGLARFGKPVLRGIKSLVQRLPEPQRNIWRMARNLGLHDPEDIAAIIHGVLVGPTVPTRKARQAMQAPTLIIGHGGDWLHNLEDARVLAREMPNARFVIARSILELRLHPERLMPKILKFLERTQSPPPAA